MRKFIRYKKTVRKKRGKIDWHPAPDILSTISSLVTQVGIDWVDTSRVFCVRSENANTRAYARIWGLSRVWQQALDEKPAYVLEVISEKYDRLDEEERMKVLLHELAHIPKNFSGSLVPHTHHGAGSFHDKLNGLLTAYRRIK